MRFLVEVRVELTKMVQFGQKLRSNELDRRLIRSETYCLSEDPAVGFSVWEAESREEFEQVFSLWKSYYSETTVREVISASEAIQVLMARRKA